MFYIRILNDSDTEAEYVIFKPGKIFETCSAPVRLGHVRIENIKRTWVGTYQNGRGQLYKRPRK